MNDELIKVDENMLTYTQYLGNVLEQIEVLKSECERFKSELLRTMLKYDVKSTVINDYQISVVNGTDPYDEEIKEFDTDRFIIEHPDMYKEYLKTTTKHNNGRKTTIRFVKKGAK